MRKRIDEPSWELLRSFWAVSEHGSLTAAASALATTQPTIGRHIAALEDALGAVLVVRHARGVELTSRGRELRDGLEPAATQIAAALESARGGRTEPHGTVRITATEIVGTHVLMPLLPALRVALPHVEVELDLDNRFVDLLRGDADIALRMQRPEQGEVVARDVGDLALGLYASERYIAVQGSPASWDELFSGGASGVPHTLIGFDRHTDMLRALEQLEPRLTRRRHAIRTDSLNAQLEAVRAGLGMCGLQVGVASRFPELVRVMRDVPLGALPIWLCMHREQRRGAVVRAVFDTLSDSLGDYARSAGS